MVNRKKKASTFGLPCHVYGIFVAKIAIIYNLSIGAVVELDYLCSVKISTADHIYICSVESTALPRVYFAPLLAVHLLHI